MHEAAKRARGLGAAAAAIAALLACAPAAASPLMRAGAWRFEAESRTWDERSGQTSSVRSVSVVCLTRAFLARDPYLSAGIDDEALRARGARCEVSEYERKEDRASWRMRCELHDGVRVDARVRNTVSETTVETVIEQGVDTPAGGGRVLSSNAGRYVGECRPEHPVMR